MVAGLGFVALLAILGADGLAAGFLAGSFGNLLTAWLHYPQAMPPLGLRPRCSGACILTGASVWLAWLDPRSLCRAPVVVPAAGGLILLGLLGR